jgi:thiol-disulfide isomerase/thioredoxin
MTHRGALFLSNPSLSKLRPPLLRPHDQLAKVQSNFMLGYPKYFVAVIIWTAILLTGAFASGQNKVNYKIIPNLDPMKGQPTPEFTVATPDGKKLSLKDFRGKIVFLNFWASWCEPCREEMPEMEKLYQEFKANNFVVVAIAVKDRKQDTLDFVKELKVTFPIGLDPEGNAGVLYGAWGLPTTYLIGPKGEGLARAWGPADWHGANARKLIQDLIDGKR